MSKVMGATVFLLASGTAASSWLSHALGSVGEAAAVGAMGLAMLAASQFLGSKDTQGTANQPLNQT